MIVITFIWYILVFLLKNCESADLSPAFTWNQIQFDNPPVSDNSIVSPYIAGNVSPYGISYHAGSNRIFVTVPRLGPGVPATISYIDAEDSNSSPLLKPYPSYDKNTPVV